MAKRIKILYDASILANGLKQTSSRSGVFFVAYNILLELTKINNVSLVLYVNNKFSFAFNFIKADPNLKNLTFYNHFFLNKLSSFKDNLKVKRTKSKSKILKLFLNFARGIISFILKLIFNRKKKIDNNFDIFFSPLFKIPDNIRNNKKIKKFTISYDMIPFIFPEYHPNVQRGNFWFLSLMDSLNKDDYIFTISNHTKKDLIRLNKNIDKNKITTTYLATSDNFYQCKDKKKINKVLKKYNIPKNTKYIFSLCTLEPRKNLVHLVKCFIEFINKYNINDLYFVLGGGHWDTFIKSIEKEIKDFNKSRNRILKIGYVDDEDLASLYSNAIFFVYPSLYEGFGLPPLEAMKCGTPVIVSNTSSLPEVVGNAGLMVDPKNEKQLVKTMYKLYNNEKLRKELSKKGLKQAKKFSWEKTVDQMVKRFREALDH